MVRAVSGVRPTFCRPRRCAKRQRCGASSPTSVPRTASPCTPRAATGMLSGAPLGRAFFFHAARLKSVGEYVDCRTGAPAHLHPSSALYGLGHTPDYVVYHELVSTAKEYMQCVTAVEPQWLAEAAPAFYSIKTDAASRLEAAARAAARAAAAEAAVAAAAAARAGGATDAAAAARARGRSEIVTPGVRRATDGPRARRRTFGL